MLLLPGCTEYHPLDLTKDPPVVVEVEPADSSAADSEPPPLVEEQCDGIDNDDDGQVDEGFLDVDHDGTADCVDMTCTVPGVQAGGVEGARTCPVPSIPPVDPWNIEMIWEWGAPEPEWTCRVDAVADLNRDGVLDIVCGTYYEPFYTVSGDGTGLLWEVPEFLWVFPPTAVADVNYDGWLEVFIVDHDGYMQAYDHTGNFLWRSTDTVNWESFTDMGGGVMVVDPFGQHQPLVVTFAGSVDARTGVTVATWWNPPPGSKTYRTRSFEIADLNLDGTQEFYDQKMQWAWDGTLVWDFARFEDSLMYTHVVAVQADTDPEGELIIHDFPFFGVYDTDGTLLFEQNLYAPDEAYYNIEPCAGDLDNDGQMEWIFPAKTGLQVYGLDGQLRWEVPAPDDGYEGSLTASASCTVFDFELDGFPEIIVDYTVELWIVDGQTGTIHWKDTGLRADMGGEMPPIIIDLDGDGSVEILLSLAGEGIPNEPILRVYGNVNRDWPPGKRIWTGMEWSGVERFADGTVPRIPDPSWSTTRLWRGSPPYSDEGTDLLPSVTACEASCEGGEIRLAVQLQNLGPQDAKAGTPLAVYRVDAAGVQTLDQVLTTTDWLNVQMGTASWELVFDRSEVPGGVVLVAGDDGTGLQATDCDTSNNTVHWQSECPQ